MLGLTRSRSAFRRTPAVLVLSDAFLVRPSGQSASMSRQRNKSPEEAVEDCEHLAEIREQAFYWEKVRIALTEKTREDRVFLRQVLEKFRSLPLLQYIVWRAIRYGRQVERLNVVSAFELDCDCQLYGVNPSGLWESWIDSWEERRLVYPGEPDSEPPDRVPASPASPPSSPAALDHGSFELDCHTDDSSTRTPFPFDWDLFSLDSPESSTLPFPEWELCSENSDLMTSGSQ